MLTLDELTAAFSDIEGGGCKCKSGRFGHCSLWTFLQCRCTWSLRAKRLSQNAHRNGLNFSPLGPCKNGIFKKRRVAVSTKKITTADDFFDDFVGAGCGLEGGAGCWGCGWTIPMGGCWKVSLDRKISKFSTLFSYHTFSGDHICCCGGSWVTIGMLELVICGWLCWLVIGLLVSEAHVPHRNGLLG